ncbi:hypothetical protein M758_9G102500 [Ceratodon purpureus]|uniref:Uncharacterized protein n=1 Tax=Ceratodon purpureus TaxID=3225 RepID=A0A8T0GVT9_CERPU|nr:hypothetical protein KC19_9G154200 [Ceratodon purpureus]KAG0605968.1 hypothetical protein M758_9G102500 [Ceratodon purpureus]
MEKDIEAELEEEESPLPSPLHVRFECESIPWQLRLQYSSLIFSNIHKSKL